MIIYKITELYIKYIFLVKDKRYLHLNKKKDKRYLLIYFFIRLIVKRKYALNGNQIKTKDIF